MFDFMKDDPELAPEGGTDTHQSADYIGAVPDPHGAPRDQGRNLTDYELERDLRIGIARMIAEGHRLVRSIN